MLLFTSIYNISVLIVVTKSDKTKEINMHVPLLHLGETAGVQDSKVWSLIGEG